MSRTANGAAVLPYVGSDDTLDALFTTERDKFAPTFYACSFSFVKYLAERAGLNQLVGLFAFGPAERRARLDRLAGKKLSAHRADWLAFIQMQ